MALPKRSYLAWLTILLMAAFGVIALFQHRANRPLVLPGDAPWVEKARLQARTIFRDGAAHDRATFPIVMRMADRICVELRATAADGAGTYLACYDRRTGDQVEERADTGY